MKKWILVILLIGVFVFSKVNVFAVEGSCGGPDEPCCQDEQGKLDCHKCDTCFCINRNGSNICKSTTTPNKCECTGSSSCRIFQEANFCDASVGKKAYCVYDENRKCGKNLTGLYTCKCADQQEFQNDKEINGYNQYYEIGTCVAKKTGSVWYEKYYIEQEYCTLVGKEPRLYYCAQGTNYFPVECRCVESSYPNDIGVGECFKLVPSTKIIPKPGSNENIEKYKEEFVYGTNQKLYCEDKGNDENPYIRTALGCIPISINGFIGWIVPSLFGIIGGIAFLIMIYGFIMMSASDGDPKKAQAAKETITAAITGLLLSIFAIFLVRLIMLYILKLPGVK